MKKILSSFVLLLAILCQSNFLSNAEPLHGDIHSEIAPILGSRMPYVALITDRTKSNTLGYHLCTGTLLTKDKVLTSTSCIKKSESIQNLEVTFETTNEKLGRHKRFRVRSIYTYEEWCMNHQNCFFDKYTDDLCFLKLDTIDVGIPYAVLSQVKKFPVTGSSMKLIGWGHTRDDFFPKSAHKAYAVLLSKPQCEQRVRKLVPSCLSNVVLPERVMCAAADPPVLAVHGDYGGPVFYERDRSISGMIIQRCPMYHPLDVGPGQVNLIIHLSYYSNFLRDAMYNDH
ncbi:hypothetical protein QAD02_011395 [Eretmocerus hayati]|uniref:Uncharacterized protein n=1 Tax=Eretmocerus hayati TaxID=131215 RepID=A0ACC2NWF6_9HYME|nr:hypothetical protein QAD02_011395 [Eretmocerus hayati]